MCSARYAPLPGRSGCACPPGRQAARSAGTATGTACRPARRGTQTRRARSIGGPPSPPASLLVCVTLITDLSRLASNLIEAAISLPDFSPAPPVEKSPPTMRTDLACPKCRDKAGSGHRGCGFGQDTSSTRRYRRGAPPIPIERSDSAEPHTVPSSVRKGLARGRPGSAGGAVIALAAQLSGRDLSQPAAAQSTPRPDVSSSSPSWQSFMALAARLPRRTPTRLRRSPMCRHRPVNTRPLGMLR